MAQQRGRVLRDTNVGPGLLTVGGKQYTFTLEDMWLSEVPPRPGMIVDVTFSAEGTPRDVRVVPDTQLAREQTEQTERAEQTGQAAQAAQAAQATQAKQQAQPGQRPIRSQAESTSAGARRRAFWLPLVAEALMLIAFFALPNLLVGNALGRRVLTGWEAIGFNLATQTVSDRGLLSSLALVCLGAPLGVFLHKPWSRWLYAAPLGFAMLAFATIFLEIQNAGQAASQGVAAMLGDAAAAQMTHQVTGMFTIGMGAYLVFLCSAYLASRGLKISS